MISDRTIQLIKTGAAGLLLIIALLIVLAPIGPLPGFFIGGTATVAPVVWKDTRDLHEVRLRVDGTLPRVVIIWVVQLENELYVMGSNESGWVSMLGEGGPVELRIDGATYSLTAQRMTTGQLPVIEAYQEKYRPDYPDIVNGMGSPGNMISGASVYRLAR